MPKKAAPRTVKVLSIQQPHADNIVFGSKWCENRTWKTLYRGELYIHASRWDGKPDQTDGNGQIGAIIGKCELVACVTVEDLDAVYEATFKGRTRRAKPLAVTERLQPLLALVAEFPESSWDHVSGPLCFVLTDRTPLPEPIPAKGRLNVWTTEIPI